MAGMKRRGKRLLVIDADVARAAGPSPDPSSDSYRCREFLDKVFSICHRVVVSKEIEKEWNEHQSWLFVNWLNKMEIKKKRKDDPDIQPDPVLRKKVEALGLSSKDEAEILKDLKLIEAALAADCVIVSKNEKDRKKFDAIACQVKELQGITWVNPVNLDENPIGWLKSGARNEKERRLGSSTTT
jgi:hypothetical protein